MADSDTEAVVPHRPAAGDILKAGHEGDLLAGVPGVGELCLSVKDDTATAEDHLRVQLNVLKTENTQVKHLYFFFI